MLGVAAGAWCDASVGVGAADEVHAFHEARAGRAGRFQEKPGDCSGIGRCILLEGFAFDAAAVAGSPGGASTMRAHDRVGVVIKVGIGSFEDPLRTGIGLFAGVDLYAFAGDGEDGMRRGRGFGGILCVDREGCGEKAEDGEDSCGGRVRDSHV